MRNPIRFKNLKTRLWPAYLAGAFAIAFSAPSPTSISGGIPFVLFGIAVRSWGAGHLNKNDLFVCTGPYAYVRHPFYLGTLAIGVGFAVMLGGRGAIAGLALLLPWFFVFYFPRKEAIESTRLTGLHGLEYERYRAAVPALWPVRGKYADADAARWSAARYDQNNELGTLLACAAGLVILGVLAPSSL